MKLERERAIAATMAPCKTLHRTAYRRTSAQSRRISGILATLLFGSQGSHQNVSERTVAMNSIDSLIRLKMNLGLFREARHDFN